MDQIMLMYQKKVLDLISEVSKESSKFNSQMANVLRLYYLGLNSIFITEKILKNVNFSSFDLSSDEKKNVENAGWILDETYLKDVYLPALKTNLILDAWLVFKENKKDILDFEKKFQILINSFFNGIKATENVQIDLVDGDFLKLEKDEVITSITPEIVLSIVKTIIRESDK